MQKINHCIWCFYPETTPHGFSQTPKLEIQNSEKTKKVKPFQLDQGKTDSVRSYPNNKAGNQRLKM
jgi:hypothetical protein